MEQEKTGQESATWYTVRETAETLKVTPGTVLQWIARGRLEAVTCSKKTIRISGKALNEFMKSR